MIRHRQIRLSLYDFVREELDPAQRKAVETHLRDCPACRRELGEVRTVVAGPRSPAEQPSHLLPDTYWKTFAARTGERIARTRSSAGGSGAIVERLRSLFFDYRRWVLAAGGSTVAVGLLLFFLRPATGIDRLPVINAGAEPAPTTDQRVHQVFRRSKALLVGLDNLRPASGRPLDLSTERHVSRELVTETRALRNAPLSPRSALVVRDLERILIELANTDDRGGAPQMEIIRNGMRQENILFRLRMAEASRDPARMKQAGRENAGGTGG